MSTTIIRDDQNKTYVTCQSFQIQMPFGMPIEEWGRLQVQLLVQIKMEMDSFREEEAREYTAYILMGCKKLRLVSWPKKEDIIEFDVVG